MTLEGVTAAGRAAAERLFVDTCTISRGATLVFDPVTGTYSQAAGTVVYTGRCRLRAVAALSGQEQDVGEQEVALRQSHLELPWDATVPEVDDLVTLTSSDDTRLLTRALRVTAVRMSSTLLVRRLTVEEVDES